MNAKDAKMLSTMYKSVTITNEISIILNSLYEDIKKSVFLGNFSTKSSVTHRIDIINKCIKELELKGYLVEVDYNSSYKTGDLFASVTLQISW